VAEALGLGATNQAIAFRRARRPALEVFAMVCWRQGNITQDILREQIGLPSKTSASRIAENGANLRSFGQGQTGPGGRRALSTTAEGWLQVLSRSGLRFTFPRSVAAKRDNSDLVNAVLRSSGQAVTVDAIVPIACSVWASDEVLARVSPRSTRNRDGLCLARWRLDAKSRLAQRRDLEPAWDLACRSKSSERGWKC